MMANSEHVECKYSLCTENEAAQSMIEVGTITETVKGTVGGWGGGNANYLSIPSPNPLPH